MDYLMLYGATEGKIYGLVSTARVATEDIGMSFRIDWCTVFEMKRWKEAQCKAISLGSNEIRIAKFG